MSKERREWTRFDFSIEVNLESDSNFYTGLTQDISGGGLFLATYKIGALGDKMHVHFTLPGNNKKFEADCEVRWIRGEDSGPGMPAGMGLRFLDMPEDDKTVITAFIARRESLFFDDE